MRRGQSGGELPLALRTDAGSGHALLSEHSVAVGRAEASLRERGSRFFAFVAPATDAETAKAFVAELARRYPDATHVCFAWRLGWPPVERASDAGEPSGTAGAPILAALRSLELTDTVTAVVRYFGGTQLGKGGLARAYGEVARAALAQLSVRPERPRVRLLVSCPYEQVGAVRRLLRHGEIELAGERYGAAAELTLAVALEARSGLESALADLRLEVREETA